MPPTVATPYRRALIVANPVSGSGAGAQAALELQEGMRSRGVPTELFYTTAAGDAFTRLRSAVGELDLVVSVGGDGTLREVMDGLVDPSTAVGVLPFGTANVLAKELGLPRDVHHCLDILFNQQVFDVDVTRVNGQLSLLMTGVGFDALTVREVARRRNGPITKLSYISAALRALAGYRPPILRIELDGEALAAPCGLVLVSNAMNYGGVLRLSPEARMDDGLLEVYLFPTGSLFEVGGAFVRGALKHLPGGRVTMRRARHVRVTSDLPVPFQFDGDLGGVTPVEIALAKNRYRLVVP